MREEWPALLDRLCADPGTVLDLEDPKPLRFCVLSPFRGQLWTLQKLLNEWLADEDNRRAVREKAAARREDFLHILEGLGMDTYLACYIRNGAHFDCVVCRGDRILLAVEVDGAHHRTVKKNRDNDDRKNAIAGAGFRAATYRAAGGGLKAEGGAPPAESGFDFLRLPTDGSAWNEEVLIEGLLRARLAAEGGPVYELPVRTLEDLPAIRQWKALDDLTRPQNWLTGRPAERDGPGENVRWVPTEDGTREGLMMAYLPGSGDRLHPGLVCQKSSWEKLKHWGAPTKGRT